MGENVTFLWVTYLLDNRFIVVRDECCYFVDIPIVDIFLHVRVDNLHALHLGLFHLIYSLEASRDL